MLYVFVIACCMLHVPQLNLLAFAKIFMPSHTNFHTFTVARLFSITIILLPLTVVSVMLSAILAKWIRHLMLIRSGCLADAIDEM